MSRSTPPHNAPPRLSTEVEQALAKRESECAAQAAVMDDLSERFAFLSKMIEESSDAVPEPIDAEEDSLVLHVERSRAMR